MPSNKVQALRSNGAPWRCSGKLMLNRRKDALDLGTGHVQPAWKTLAHLRSHTVHLPVLTSTLIRDGVMRTEHLADVLMITLDSRPPPPPAPTRWPRSPAPHPPAGAKLRSRCRSLGVRALREHSASDPINDDLPLTPMSPLKVLITILLPIDKGSGFWRSPTTRSHRLRLARLPRLPLRGDSRLTAWAGQYRGKDTLIHTAFRSETGSYNRAPYGVPNAARNSACLTSRASASRNVQSS
jgi:hypothetical protein